MEGLPTLAADFFSHLFVTLDDDEFWIFERPSVSFRDALEHNIYGQGEEKKIRSGQEDPSNR
jgi:hypothetical protein